MRSRRLTITTTFLLALAASAYTGSAHAASGAPSAQAPPVRCDGHVATIVGTSGDDVLTGTSGADVIAGLGGNDTIDGLGGNDIICGDAGSDHLSGGPGADRLFGGQDEEFDSNDDGDFVLIGDTLDGGPGNDFLSPGVGIERFGSTTQHELDTGWVGDVISYADSATGVRVDLPHGEATGDGHDTFARSVLRQELGITGSAHDDVVIGAQGYTFVDAGAGDDVVRAPHGADITESPGSGNDDYVTGPTSDRVSLVDGRDRVSTGGGNDSVSVGPHHPGSGARLDTGSGQDFVTSAAIGSAYSFRGGADRDRLYLTLPGTQAVTLRLDRQLIRRSGAVHRIPGFEGVNLTVSAPVTVVGGAERDVVGVSAPRLTAHLGGGNDRLTIDPHGRVNAWLGTGDDKVLGLDDGPPYAPKVLHGGPGRDAFRAASYDVTCDGFEVGTCRGTYVPPTCDGKSATIVGTLSGHEHLVGTAGPDVIVANGPYDTVDGDGGDDTICGDGTDTVHGGPGDDTLLGNSGDDLSGDAGDDLLVLGHGGTFDYSGAPGPVSVDLAAGTASGDGTDTLEIGGSPTVVGSPFADHITGGPESDRILPGAGDDVVDAGAGDDSVEDQGDDSGDDHVTLGPGDDFYTQTSGADTVDGGADGDTVLAESPTRGRLVTTNVEHGDVRGLVDGDSLSGSIQWAIGGTAPASIDLSAGTITQAGRTGHVGVNPWFIELPDTTLTGTAGADTVTVDGQAGSALTVQLLGGDDRVSGIFTGGTVDLGDGDDEISGGWSGMQLEGGIGTDTLDLVSGSGNTCTGFEIGACNP